MKARASVNTVVLVIYIIIAFFHQPLNLSYFPEIVTLLMAGYILTEFFKTGKMSKFIGKIILLFLGIVLVGLIGNAKSGITRSTTILLMDIFYIAKDFICFCGAWLLFQKVNNKSEVVKALGSVAKFITAVAFVFMIVNMAVGIGMSDDVRYGIPSFKFVFDSSAWLSQHWIIIIILLTANLQYDHKKNNKIYIGCALLVWMMTLRSRAFVMVAIYCAMWFWLVKGKQKKDYEKHLFRLKNIVPALILVVLIGYDQLENYFLGEKISARSLLLTTGIKIMKDYFPFGTGFATFGTEMARRFYSPIYYTYGLNTFWALKEGGKELTDCYWPAIFGETGIIGTILIAIVIYMIFRDCIKRSKQDLFIFMSIVLYEAYLLISSTATGIFTSDLTAMYMIIVALLVCAKDDYNSRGDKYGNDCII